MAAPREGLPTRELGHVVTPGHAIQPALGVQVDSQVCLLASTQLGQRWGSPVFSPGLQKELHSLGVGKLGKLSSFAAEQSFLAPEVKSHNS